MTKRDTITKETLFQLLGGRWPEVEGYEGFCWPAVPRWVVEDGMLHPVDGFGHYVPGPSFRILVPIPNPFP